MLAIKITQEIKDKNKRYNLPFVKDNAIGKIVKTSLPNKFYVKFPVSGGYRNRKDLHIEDGFKTISTPSFDTETHKLGNIILEVDNDFIYNTIALTEKEIANNIKTKQDQPIQEEFENYLERREDGINAYLRLSAELRVMKVTGVIDETRHISIDNALIPVREEMINGQWISGRQKLIDIEPSIIGVNFYSKLLSIITEYIDLDY